MNIFLALALIALSVLPAAADREPKLALEEASGKARSAAGGGVIERAELEQQGERLVWAFDVKAGTDSIKQVWLDAETGELLKLDSEQGAQREAYAQAARKQLTELDAKIAALRKEAGTRSQEARRLIEARAAALDERRAQAEKELAALESTGRSRWRRFKTGLDRALLELRRGYDEAVSTGTVVTSPPDGTR